MNRRCSLFGWAASIGLLVLIGLLACRKAGVDFHVFYQAGVRLRAGVSPYQEADGNMPFKYSPVAALFLLPLSFVSEATARHFWIVLTGVSLLACLKIWGDSHASRFSGWTAFSALVLTWPLVAQELFLGQCDVVLLGLVALSEYFLAGFPVLAGSALAMACFFKPPFLLLVLPLCVARRWAALTGGLAITLLFCAGGMFQFGTTYYFELFSQWRRILVTTTGQLLCTADNQSLWGVACRYWASPGTVLYLIGIGAVGLPLLILWMVLQKKRPNRARGFGLYLTSFLSPLGWLANLLSIIPSLFTLMSEPFRRGALAALALMAATTLMSYDVIGPKTFHQFLLGRGFALSTLVVALIAVSSSARIRR